MTVFRMWQSENQDVQRVLASGGVFFSTPGFPREAGHIIIVPAVEGGKMIAGVQSWYGNEADKVELMQAALEWVKGNKFEELLFTVKSENLEDRDLLKKHFEVHLRAVVVSVKEKQNEPVSVRVAGEHVEQETARQGVDGGRGRGGDGGSRRKGRVVKPRREQVDNQDDEGGGGEEVARLPGFEGD